MNTRHKYIELRAYKLWQIAGQPKGRDVEFWLQAEKEHDCGVICILEPESCPYQYKREISGGRCISLCTREHGECLNRAVQYL